MKLVWFGTGDVDPMDALKEGFGHNYKREGVDWDSCNGFYYNFNFAEVVTQGFNTEERKDPQSDEMIDLRQQLFGFLIKGQTKNIEADEAENLLEGPLIAESNFSVETVMSKNDRDFIVGFEEDLFCPIYMFEHTI